MTWVQVDDLCVAYGETTVLEGIDLTVPRGSLVAMLGPSGCGKTTFLRVLAGLHPATRGSITVGGRTLTGATTHIPAEKRGIGWVPQHAALFPHQTVAENIGFGLPREGRADRIAELAALVGMTWHLARSPAQLSGGQAQRVALARALAPRPDLILLDEPFAALDPLLRSALRVEVAELLRRQNTTSVLVTHDQEEALSLADYVAVMNDGRILQWGTPAEVYEHPATPWVARFVGDTVELVGRWRGGRVECALGSVEAETVGGFAPAANAPVRVLLRPEWLELSDTGADAVVTSVAYAGHDALVEMKLTAGEHVRARLAAPILPRRGDLVHVGVRYRALAYAL